MRPNTYLKRQRPQRHPAPVLPQGLRPKSSKGAMGKTILIVEDNELNMKLFHDEKRRRLRSRASIGRPHCQRIREGGCEAYVSKPISVSRFLETIRQFIPTNLS
ncbi:chemotaxis protein CheY [Rhodomicrobium udaipurense JA643]|nr:chemotaxis protein CheY [Rhodomicrobium udaipurense JA643]